MKAFFVHDAKKDDDLMVIPETGAIVNVDRDVLEMFIAVEPDFSRYSGKNLNDLPPDALGEIVATRKTDGDVCILDQALWQRRMSHHLG